MIEDTIKFIKSKFNNQKLVPLHSPVFIGNEKKYLNECIDTTFVSSVGSFVNTFEINSDDVLCCARHNVIDSVS